MAYQSTKQFGHDLGLSCCFRQWRAESHCNQLHGYAIAVKFTFQAEELDGRNWVVDFGGLKELKQEICDMFDHKLLVAEDDPFLDEICGLVGIGVASVVVIPHVGCEAFAKLLFELAEDWLLRTGIRNRVHLVSCEVKEHGANSALYIGE
jgi:6-pyruvoyltetrahydropterin/6-carboxytetrahydropterin synthase